MVPEILGGSLKTPLDLYTVKKPGPNRVRQYNIMRYSATEINTLLEKVIKTTLPEKAFSAQTCR